MPRILKGIKKMGWLERDIRTIKKLIVLVIGLTVMIMGIMLLFLPGPGIPIIFLGIVILAAEFLWARYLLKRIRKEFRKSKKLFKKL